MTDGKTYDLAEATYPLAVAGSTGVTIAEEIRCLLDADWMWDGDKLVHPQHQGAKTGIASVDFIAVAARGGSKLAGLTWGEKTCSANLADTERNERQAFKRQQVSAAKSEMAYHNHFVLNSLGGNPKSAMPVFPFVFPFSRPRSRSWEDGVRLGARARPDAHLRCPRGYRRGASSNVSVSS
jgi:hypothetical protein